AGQCTDLSDAVAHGPGTDDGDDRDVVTRGGVVGGCVGHDRRSTAPSLEQRATVAFCPSTRRAFSSGSRTVIRYKEMGLVMDARKIVVTLVCAAAVREALDDVVDGLSATGRDVGIVAGVDEQPRRMGDAIDRCGESG